MGWTTPGVVGKFQSKRNARHVHGAGPVDGESAGLEGVSLELEHVEKARVVGGDGWTTVPNPVPKGGPGGSREAEGRDVHVAGLIDGNAARLDVAERPRSTSRRGSRPWGRAW